MKFPSFVQSVFWVQAPHAPEQMGTSHSRACYFPHSWIAHHLCCRVGLFLSNWRGSKDGPAIIYFLLETCALYHVIHSAMVSRLHTHTPHFSNGFTHFFTCMKLIVTIQDGVTQRLERHRVQQQYWVNVTFNVYFSCLSKSNVHESKKQILVTLEEAHTLLLLLVPGAMPMCV